MAAKELLFKSFSTTVLNVSRRKNKDHKQLKELQSGIDNLKRMSTTDSFNRNINEKRGDCLLDSCKNDTGPMGLHPVHSLYKYPVNTHFNNSPLKVQTCNNLIAASLVTKSTQSQPVARSAVAETSLCGSAVVTRQPATVVVGHSVDPFAMKQRDIKSKLFF